MLNKIIAFSINNKLVVNLGVLFLIGYGVFQLTKLPIDAVPDITDNQVQIITITPALGAPDVERLITFPIELANNTIPGLKQIRSFSRFGLSVVTIVFDDDVDIYWARQQVTERLQQVQDEIPKAFGTPELAPVTTGLGEIYQYSIHPAKGYENKYSAMELRTIQDWIVRRQLLGVKGVADVSSFGGYLKQYEIGLDPQRLKAHNITINEVFDALEKNNQNTGGAYIEKGPTVLFIRTEGLASALDDINAIVIKNLPNGSPLLIRDVAEVRFGNATRYGAMTYNGEKEVCGAVVMMLKGANSNEVIENIKERISEIQKTLPEGVVIDAFLDRTKMVNNAISTVENNLLEGALIVVFVLVLFLGNIRAGFIVASVIPLSMLFAVIMMNVFGVSGNLMSLGALDFGLIVDGAVIIVEAVMHRLTHRKKAGVLSREEMNGEVEQSASRMVNSAVFGQLIILIVYLPIFSLVGIEGKMFKPMAQTVAFALAGAFLLSLTYVPMMSAWILRSKRSNKPGFSDRMMARVEQVYRKVLVKVLSVPKRIVAGAVILFVTSLFILTSLGGEFIPTLEEGDFAVETRVLTGSNLTTSMTAVSEAAKILLAKFPEVKQVVGKTGSSEIPTDPMPIDASDMMIILKDKSQWTSASTFPELEEKMSQELEAVPGVTFGFQYPVQMRFNELISGARQDVVCKIFGENLDTLANYAKLLGNISSSVEGSSGVYVEAATGMPQIVIRYNRAAIAQYGLNIEDINNVINMAFAGQASGLVFENERRFDLVVRLLGENRKQIEDVQNLLIPTPSNTQIPLYQVANITVEEGANQIQREDAKRRIIVGFNVRGRDVQSMVEELRQKVSERIQLPAGYYITYGGAFENFEAATKRLYIVVPIALLLIFLLLYFAFKSMREGLLIYSAVPLSAVGGIFALALRGLPFSISAGVGFIALFGVAVLNGIVLVSEFDRLRKEGFVDLKEIVLAGTQVRLRPVLMTALVASLGFLPMAISNGAGAEVQRPLATVVIGGLLLATLLTLFVLPVLYTLFMGGSKQSGRRSFPASIMDIFPIRGKKHKKETMIGPMVIGFVIFPLLSVHGQSPITLQQAIDSARKNNLSLQTERSRAEYLEMLIGTAWDIPQTTLSIEYGKINSPLNDTKLSISQNIKFPLVYAQQHTVLQNEWREGALTVAEKERETKLVVSKAYYTLRYFQEKRKLLEHTDSIYAAFLQTASLREKAGESDKLETITATTKRIALSRALREATQNIDAWLLQFNTLLHSSGTFVPFGDPLKIAPVNIDRQIDITAHPFMSVLHQQKELASSQSSLERTKLLPDLFVAYNNMSMNSPVAGDNPGRFQSFQIGVGLPLFFSGQQSNIEAAGINERIANERYRLNLESLQTRYEQAAQRYRSNQQTIDQFERTVLESSNTMLALATSKFTRGEIDYLQWVILVNEALAVQGDYLDAVRDFNDSVIELEYCINN